MNRPIPNGPWHQRRGTLSDLPGLGLGAQDPRRMAWCTTGPGPQGQREGQADAGGGGQAYGQPRRADLSVVLGDGRLAVSVVVKAAEPGPVRAGCAAYGLEGVRFLFREDVPHGAISSRSGPDPRIRPAGQARKHRRAEPLLPASAARDCFPAVCVQTCGSLVRNGAEPVHMQWKCWGFLCLCRHLIGTLPGRTRVARCACRERRNYPHATPQ